MLGTFCAKMMLRVGFVVVMAAISAPLLKASPPPPSFNSIPGIPGGAGDSRAAGVSADGLTVVGEGGFSGVVQAYRWTQQTGTVGLGFLPGHSSTTFGSSSAATSADGSVIVGYSDSASGNEAFRWTQSTGMVGLGKLAGYPSASYALSVSGNGSLIVGQGVQSGDAQAFRWTQAEGMVGLGYLSGGSSFGRADGVSADGSIIVGQSSSTPGLQAFRWTQATGMVGLGDLPGGNFSSRAFGISPDGSTIVGSSNSGNGAEAFRWTQATGMVGLGSLTRFAEAASGDGSVVVGYGMASPTAFIWDAVHGTRDLKDVLTNDYGLGAAVAGWHLSDAHSISTDGTMIVGSGIDPDGNERAFVAVVPEPSGLVLAAMASGMLPLTLIGRCKRK